MERRHIEVVPPSVSQKDLSEESYRIAAKKGYCTKDGLPPFRTKIMCAPPTKRYEKEYVRIFGHD